MTTREPSIDPRPGDVVRSFYPSSGSRRVVSVSECGVRYVRIDPNGIERDGYCLPGVWKKWCRAHRVRVVKSQEPAP